MKSKSILAVFFLIVTPIMAMEEEKPQDKKFIVTHMGTVKREKSDLSEEKYEKGTFISPSTGKRAERPVDLESEIPQFPEYRELTGDLVKEKPYLKPVVSLEDIILDELQEEYLRNIEKEEQAHKEKLGKRKIYVVLRPTSNQPSSKTSLDSKDMIKEGNSEKRMNSMSDVCSGNFEDFEFAMDIEG